MKTVLWISVALALGLYICQPIMDPDLWWHIVVGRWILDRGYVPTSEHWNMFAVGKPWVAYSWSNEVVYAFTESLYGIKGLACLKLLLGILLSISLFWTLSKVAKDWFFGAILGIFAVAACHSHFVLRPQTFVWVLFSYLLYYLIISQREGWTTGRLIGLFVVFSLWANSHITTVIGIATLATWNFSSLNLRKIALPLAVAFLGTLATPYFGTEWLIFLGKTSHPLEHVAIAEFGSASILQFASGFLLMGIAALLLFIHEKPAWMNLGRAALLLVLCIASLAVIKFLPMAVIAICFALAEYWASSEGGKNLGGFAEGIEKLRSLVDWLPKQGLAFVFIAIAVINFVGVIREPLDHSLVPKEAVDFIETNKLAAPILNDFGRGGYLMYRFSDPQGNPSQLVAIDGRTNVVPHDVMKKFMQAFQGKSNWHEYFDLVKPETVLWRNDSPLVAILENGSQWCRVYKDGTEKIGFSVFLKVKQVNSNKSLSCL
ncbi:MAG: hypothetical protein R3A13_10350 [Bdellovibrionota bacterium]